MLCQNGVDNMVAATHVVDDVDDAREREYSLLATLLSRSPDARMIERLTGLCGDDSPMGRAHAALGAATARTDAEKLEGEYFDLFVRLGTGGILPYSSYYLTGYLYGAPLARLRQTLQRLGLERTERQSEPEDHAAILFDLMAGIAGGKIAVPVGADRDIFQSHLAPWIGRFFADLEHAEPATFYACVGALGRTFMEIETEAFSLPPYSEDARTPVGRRKCDQLGT
jgi:TorA maturation chaperone TorD